jgi:predicted GNAT family N-acyltransferase
MALIEIQYGSLQYSAALALRNEVLRKPLGLDLLEEALSAEAAHRHFGLVEGGDLLACLLVVRHGETLVQIRQMAVQPQSQGRGHGGFLMRGVEEILRSEGSARKIFLNARLPAVPFYRKLGYLPAGGEFTEVGIPHLRMEKPLA